ncbi:MAG TPA: WbuC family cupin fold metalloprotein [Gemmatimonadaceae bacterium]|nr:WbuC family cupin fold metalloprotein [Gemmatimonadaceae bacterium]HLA90405.1 WbuC family cupin fold metalloprotein [Gemmatimonadaceae bacterium]
MNVIYASENIEFVGPETLERLKELAREHTSRRSRLCLHHDQNAPTHEMIVVAHKSTYIRAHRHPKHKSESYHVIEGEMEVRIFGARGELLRVVRLRSDLRGAFMSRVTNGEWHQPVPLTEWVVYHETYSGPFEKNVDVEYASWAPEERGPEGAATG